MSRRAGDHRAACPRPLQERDLPEDLTGVELGKRDPAPEMLALDVGSSMAEHVDRRRRRALREDRLAGGERQPACAGEHASVLVLGERGEEFVALQLGTLPSVRSLMRTDRAPSALARHRETTRIMSGQPSTTAGGREAGRGPGKWVQPVPVLPVA
jgi:hypothetical protein